MLRKVVSGVIFDMISIQKILWIFILVISKFLHIRIQFMMIAHWAPPPVHQPPWNPLCKLDRSFLVFQRGKDLNYMMCHLNIEKWWKNCKYILVFPKLNLAQQGSSSPSIVSISLEPLKLDHNYIGVCPSKVPSYVSAWPKINVSANLGS